MSASLQTRVIAKPSSTVAPSSIPTGLLQRKCACGGAAGLDDECAECRSTRLQRKPVGQAKPTGVPPIVHEVLRSPGQPLDEKTRTFMEPRFGHDFSRVRVHTDAKATESAQAVNALAYTVGRHVVFREGRYAPSTPEGKRLLAHELTHVVQQESWKRPAETAHRQADETVTATPVPGDSDLTALLFAHIGDIERVLSLGRRKVEAARSGGAQGEGVPAESQGYVETVEQGLERMRSIANGTDEELKRNVLAAFDPDRLLQAEEQIGAAEGVEVRERRPEGITAKLLQVSHPYDAAESEADRVAHAVVSGSMAAVRYTSLDDVLNRQVAEALVAAGMGVLAADAEAAPVEAVTGPPGWAVGLAVAVVGLALIGTGYILMSARGNVADTGIMDEVNSLIEAAKAAGRALTICEALAQLMAAAEAARDTKRIQRIKTTQNAKGCRHSRHS